MNSNYIEKIITGFANFLTWWVRELTFLMPQGMRKRLFRSSPTSKLFLPLEGDIDDKLEACEFGQSVVLHINSDWILTKTVMLPKADYRIVKEMAAVQISRLMPLSRDALYTDWRIIKGADGALEGDVDDQKQNVQLYAIKRSALDPILHELNARNWIIQDVVLEGGGNLFKVLPFKARQSLYYQCLKKVGLFSFFLLGLVMIPYAWLWNLEGENNEVSDQLQTLKQEVSELSKKRDLLDSYYSREEFLGHQRLSDKLYESLALLTTESPDNLWLQEFNFSQGHLRLVGYAQSSAEWALKLEGLDSVERAQLQQVSAGRTKDDPENFSILIDLAKGGRP